MIADSSSPPAALEPEARFLVDLLRSRLVGVRKARGYTSPLCRLLAVLYQAEPPASATHAGGGGWPGPKTAKKSAGMKDDRLDRLWVLAEANTYLLPSQVLDSFFPPEICPALFAAIADGPVEFVEESYKVLTAWSSGLERDGSPRERGQLHELSSYVNAVRRLGRELSQIRKIAVSERRKREEIEQLRADGELAKTSERERRLRLSLTPGQESLIEQWRLEDLPDRKTNEELGAEPANRDRSAPPRRAVRRCLRSLTRKIDDLQRNPRARKRSGLFLPLRDRALMAVACLGFREATICSLRRCDFLPVHDFGDGKVGPALRVRNLKGLPGIVRIAAIPREVAEWILAYLEYVDAEGIPLLPEGPLWLPKRRTEWQSYQETSSSLVEMSIVRTLAPFVNGRKYSPHTFRHLAERYTFVGGLDWLTENRAMLLDDENRPGIPSNPQTFCDVQLDHRLHDIVDRYKDINTEPGRRAWRRIAVEGLWAYLWGDRGARQGVDVEGIARAAERRRAAERFAEQTTELIQELRRRKRQFQQEKAAQREQAHARVDEMSEADYRRTRFELDRFDDMIAALDDEVSEAQETRVEAALELERARQGEREARALRVAIPDEVPDDQIVTDPAEILPMPRADRATPEKQRDFIDNYELQWAIGEELLPISTLNRWLRGKLPHPPGDRRNLVTANPAGGYALGVSKPTPRRFQIAVNELPLENYHPDVVERIEWLLTRPWPFRPQSTDVVDLQRIVSPLRAA